MTIRYKCEHCGALLNIKDEKAGTKGKCPKCQESFTVPTPAGVAQDASPDDEDDFFGLLADDENGQTPAKPAPALFDQSEFEEEDEPPPRAKASPADATPNGSDVGSAAGLAEDLLAKTGKKTQPEEDTEKRRGPRFVKPSAEVTEFLTYHGAKLAGAALALVGLGVLAYMLSRSMMTAPEYPPLGEVSGVIRLDGDPLIRADVEFIPEAGLVSGSNISSSFARTDVNGQYTLVYVRGVNGAYVGKHRVEIKGSPTSKVFVPKWYNVESKLDFEVKKGQNDGSFDLKSDP